MKKDLFQIMIEFYQHHRIQLLTFQEDYANFSSIDYGFRGKIIKNFDYRVVMEHIKAYIRPQIYYSFTDDLQLHYILFQFPPDLAEELNCLTLCIGPLLFHPLDKETFQRLMNERQIPESSRSDFLEFYNRVPLISSEDTWHHTFGFFLSRLCDTLLDYKTIDPKTLELPSSLYIYLDVDSDSDVSYDTIEERYLLEEKLMRAVSTGSTQLALDTFFKFEQYRLIPRSADPLRNVKNRLIILNTLLRKATQAGNVHPLHIDTLSRQFSIQIESLTNPNQYDAFSSGMIHKYCLLVNNYSRGGCSPLIQNCMNYIDFHYHTELSLSTLAKMHFVSSSYLSALFKKETEMTITDYIQQTRIQQSLKLLNSTNLSLAEIASRCGFSETNYFARIFKKFLGKTPKEYRKSIQKL